MKIKAKVKLSESNRKLIFLHESDQRLQICSVGPLVALKTPNCSLHIFTERRWCLDELLLSQHLLHVILLANTCSAAYKLLKFQHTNAADAEYSTILLPPSSPSTISLQSGSTRLFIRSNGRLVGVIYARIMRSNLSKGGNLSLKFVMFAILQEKLMSVP